MLLAEANGWPEDVVEYFGDPAPGGDECHMAFHFPLMPRIFMAVSRETREPISEIMARTPEAPRHAQWGIFLRNHDELTLETVTEEERDYMHSEYAKDPRMRAYLGIRRRLAPLLDNDSDRIELFTALLLCLPGSPVIYYGDEIGMGDNIWLEDRDGVRTPMQWSPDRNAGFSTADPAGSTCPPSWTRSTATRRSTSRRSSAARASLLHFTRRMLEIRRSHPVFGIGAYTEMWSSNPSVLAYVREYGDDGMLCVNNLSKFPSRWSSTCAASTGMTPVEARGGVHFPRDRRAALPAHAAGPRVLLVLAQEPQET